jgi:hypothetical protein
MHCRRRFYYQERDHKKPGYQHPYILACLCLVIQGDR